MMQSHSNAPSPVAAWIPAVLFYLWSYSLKRRCLPRWEEHNARRETAIGQTSRPKIQNIFHCECVADAAECRHAANRAELKRLQKDSWEWRHDTLHKTLFFRVFSARYVSHSFLSRRISPSWRDHIVVVSFGAHRCGDV